MMQWDILVPSDMRGGLTQKPVTLKNCFALVQLPHVWLFSITLFLHTDSPLKVKSDSRRASRHVSLIISFKTELRE
jgi:hypothetical protein